MSTEKLLVEARNVSLYPPDWATVEAFAKDYGYPSTSAALRRIIDEWVAMRRERIRNAADACCEAEARATLEIPRLEAR